MGTAVLKEKKIYCNSQWLLGFQQVLMLLSIQEVPVKMVQVCPVSHHHLQICSTWCADSVMSDLCVTIPPGLPLFPLNPFIPVGPFFPGVPGKPGSPWEAKNALCDLMMTIMTTMIRVHVGVTTFPPSFPAAPGKPCSPGTPGAPGCPRSPGGPDSPDFPWDTHKWLNH